VEQVLEEAAITFAFPSNYKHLMLFGCHRAGLSGRTSTREGRAPILDTLQALLLGEAEAVISSASSILTG
jgi:hypothetical protein